MVFLPLIRKAFSVILLSAPVRLVQESFIFIKIANFDTMCTA
jgi:hypothetical protein